MSETQTNETIEFNPEKNINAIAIIRQTDGNYIGYINKDRKVLTARQGDPNTVLNLLLTSDGTNK